MAQWRSVLLCLLSTSLLATLTTTTDAASIPHSQVAVWPEPWPTNIRQYLAVRFKPLLNVVDGCQPYPAVDAAGNTSAGLKPTGTPSGSCSDKTKAQVYARTGWYKDAFAIMYSWYMPKDSPSTGMGHRHDWENIVVWLDSDKLFTSKMIALAASAHGDYKKSYPLDTKFVADSVSAKVDYKSAWPMNHALELSTSAGVKQPLIQWDQMTDAARNALETTDFGSGHVPFRSDFERYLGKAYFK